MDIVSLDLPGVKISPRKFGDARGFFSETYNRDAFAAAGLDHVFVQDNHSFGDAGHLARAAFPTTAVRSG